MLHPPTPKKHYPCANPMQQLVAPQPQAQAQESTAGHIAGGSANKIHASQQDRNTGSSSQAHTQYILHCSVYYDTGWFLFGLFPSCQKGFFPGNLKGYRVPKFNISLVGPQPLLSICHYYTHSQCLHRVAFLGVLLGRYPCGIS